MIFSFKLKPIICFICIVTLGFAGSYFLVNSLNSVESDSVLNYTIVLDAGHGGIDGGSVGAKKVTEAEINLSVTKKLETLLSGFGFNVVLTRHDSGGLYSFNASNKKQDDMKKRKAIIQNANANMVVSIHMNSYINAYEKGAQTFYLVGDDQSKLLADAIQNEMQSKLVDARKNSNHADLYILKCASVPSVVVEGGFLSNPQEEELLVSSDYQSKIAYSVFCGIVKFYEQMSQVGNNPV